MSILRKRINDPKYKEQFVKAVSQGKRSLSKEEENAYLTKGKAVKEIVQKCEKKRALVSNK